MRFALNRLLLGLLLIGLVSPILLFSDLNHCVARRSLPRITVFQLAPRPLMAKSVAGVLDGFRAEGFADGRMYRGTRP